MDILMVGLFIILAALIIGLAGWAGKVIEEGSEK